MLLEGVPGLGKTLLVRTLGDVLSLRFSRIQFTPDLMPADIIGTTIVSEDLDGRRALRFQAGPVFANLVLADEINRATPKTQSALLEAMQEQTVSSATPPARCRGRSSCWRRRTRSRWRAPIRCPRRSSTASCSKSRCRSRATPTWSRSCSARFGPAPTRSRKPVADADDVLRMLRVAREVVVAPHLVTYAVRIVLATHPTETSRAAAVRQYVRHGASPRGLQSLVAGAQVRALLEDRFNVSREDLKPWRCPPCGIASSSGSRRRPTASRRIAW